jgi:hypothetical protein
LRLVTAGDTKVFDYQNGAWQEVGTGLPSATNFSDISGDGMRVAVSNQNETQVFQYQSNNWVQLAGNIPMTGYVCLSSNGDMLALGNGSDNGGNGIVKVYELVSNTWTQIGSDLMSVDTGYFFGDVVDLSADGSKIAISQPFSPNFGFHIGRIYEFNSTDWVQIGNDIIETEASIDGIPHYMSLSADGQRIVSSAQYYPGLAKVHTLEELCDVTVSNNQNAGIGSLRHAINNTQNNDIICFSSALHGDTISIQTPAIVVNKELVLKGSDTLNIYISCLDELNIDVLMQISEKVKINGLNLVGKNNGQLVYEIGLSGSIEFLDCDILYNVDIQVD